jgi:hypothetical protein
LSIIAEHTLDRTGFEFHRSLTSLGPEDFENKEKIKTEYYAEVIETIK